MRIVILLVLLTALVMPAFTHSSAPLTTFGDDCLQLLDASNAHRTYHAAPYFRDLIDTDYAALAALPVVDIGNYEADDIFPTFRNFATVAEYGGFKTPAGQRMSIMVILWHEDGEQYIVPSGPFSPDGYTHPAPCGVYRIVR